MNTVSKTYTPLASIKGAKVVMCSALLPNHLQCWRAGDVLVTETTSIPASKDAKGVETPASITERTWQLCNFHTAQAQQLDEITTRANADLAKAQAEVAASKK